MPYKDPEANRKYQRAWAAKKARALGIPVRPKGEDIEKLKARKKRWRGLPHVRARLNFKEKKRKYQARYGEYAEVKRLVNLLMKNMKGEN